MLIIQASKKTLRYVCVFFCCCCCCFRSTINTGEPSRIILSICRHLILFPLQLELSFPNDDNTRRSRTDLGPRYGYTLVERCFWEKKKILTKPLRVHTWTWACIRSLNPCVRSHKPVYAVRIPETFVWQVFIKFWADAIPHCLELLPPLLFEHYKKFTIPFFPKT